MLVTPNGNSKKDLFMEVFVLKLSESCYKYQILVQKYVVTNDQIFHNKHSNE